MRALFRRFIRLLLVLVLAFAAVIVVLWVRTASPRNAPSWERLADMPSPRGELAAAVGQRVTDDCDPFAERCDDFVRVVVAGGLAGAGRTVRTVSIYDPSNDRWHEGPDLPAARHHVGAAGLGGVVYVSGGAASATDWKAESNFWALDPTDDEWRALAPMPEGRMGHQMVAVGQKLYVVGGRGPSGSVLIYDTVSGSWSTGAPIPTRRDHLGAAAVDEQIYAIGGRNEELLDSVDIYDVEADVWRAGPTLPEPISAMAVGALPDGIHIVGGEDPAVLTGTVIDKHYVLAEGSTRWRSAPLPTVPTHGSASVVLRDRLLIAGGARRHSAFSPISWTGVTEAFPKS